MVDDGEQKAYTQINLLFSKNQKKSLTNFYYTSYIKNKFQRMISHKYKIENIIKWQTMNQLRDRYYLRVLSNSKIPVTIKDFCGSLNRKWGTFGKDSIYNTKEINRVVEEFTGFCIQSLEESHVKIFKCMRNSYQMANLCYLILFVGGLFHIDSFELIKCFHHVSKKDYEVKCKEFEMKYYERANPGLFTHKKRKHFPFRKHNVDEDDSPDQSEKENSSNSNDLISDIYSESLFSENDDNADSQEESESNNNKKK